MDATCRRAVELGLPSIAFTDHMDWVRGRKGLFDATGYFECIERCRAAYPALRILSGVELGEPHNYPEEAREVLSGPFQRVLASVHCVQWKGRAHDASERGFLTRQNVDAVYRLYLTEVKRLAASDIPFQVLAHLDYPKRYWPAASRYDEQAYEGELRDALRALAARGAALEINTTRGGDPARYLCPGPGVVRWWREEGGEAVSFGSDAHSAELLAAGFAIAQQAAEAAGFRPQEHITGFWLR